VARELEKRLLHHSRASGRGARPPGCNRSKASHLPVPFFLRPPMWAGPRT
jgi:hypothetical protein